MTQFKMHGSVCTSVEGRMVVREMHGPWNLELVEYADQSLDSLQDFDFSQPWILMIIVSDSALCSFDALQKMRQRVNMSINAQRKGTAWVFPPETEGADLMQRVLRPLYAQLHSVAFFSDRALAYSWLVSCLEFGV